MVWVLSFFFFCWFWVLFHSVIWLLSKSCYFTLTDVWLFYTVDVFVLKGNASGVRSHRDFWEVLVCLYHGVAGVFVTEFVFVFALQLCAASGSQKDSGKWSKVKPASDSQGWVKIFTLTFKLSQRNARDGKKEMLLIFHYLRHFHFKFDHDNDDHCVNDNQVVKLAEYDNDDEVAEWKYLPQPSNEVVSVEPGWPWIPLRKFVLSPLYTPFSSSL